MPCVNPLILEAMRLNTSAALASVDDSRPHRRPPLIGLVGKAGAGKNRAADILCEVHNFQQLAFANRLREFLLLANPRVGSGPEAVRLHAVVAAYGWDHAKRTYPEVRLMLQTTGVAAREVFGADFWVKPVMAQAKKLLDGGHGVVVSDVRFPNEVKAVRAAGGVIVRIDRDGLDTGDHVSETVLDDLVADYELFNPGVSSEYRSAVLDLHGRMAGWYE